MDRQELDTLKQNFDTALQHWIASIQRLRELLADTTHSAKSEDVWKQADFEQEDARKSADKARDAYENAVREANFDF